MKEAGSYLEKGVESQCGECVTHDIISPCSNVLRPSLISPLETASDHEHGLSMAATSTEDSDYSVMYIPYRRPSIPYPVSPTPTSCSADEATGQLCSTRCKGLGIFFLTDVDPKLEPMCECCVERSETEWLEEESSVDIYVGCRRDSLSLRKCEGRRQSAEAKAQESRRGISTFCSFLALLGCRRRVS